jgi:site-specific recombinase XerD
LGIKSGFRISEILSLTLKDVFDNGRIQDRIYVQRKNMKGKNEGRCVVVHPDAKMALSTWIAELIANGASENSFVFKSRNGRNKPISRIQAWKMLTKVYEASGLTGALGTHSLRKTFADRVYEKLGHDLLKTQRALAHRDIKSTISYLAFKQQDVDEAILSI